MHFLARDALVIFLVAVSLNYPWELAQAPLYQWLGEPRNTLWHCFVASLGDGLILLLIYAAGVICFRRKDWFEPPRAQGYLVMLAAGLIIAIGVEWVAVHVAQRWAYTDRMPLLPGLSVGIIPILQMLVLPPIVFRIVAIFGSKA